jgi:hypothetical protein
MNRISTTAAAAIATIAGLYAAAPARAQAQGYVADCPVLISQVEARRNIPRGLLMAIAVTESALNGRPNPYAMNIAGRAYHAQGTQDMANVISANWQRGVKSIDVGCMQINLMYHGMKFPRMTDLLDSKTNVEYGASFLISLATESGSWKDAVMSYHNKRNPARRAWYGCKVWNNYLRLSGSQSGYMQCGRVPGGSSTASVNTRPIIMAGYNAPAQVGPLTPPDGQMGRTMVGGTAVDVMIPRKRIQGNITIVGSKGEIPDVLNDDERASAFNAVRPADWSGRVARRTASKAVSDDAPIVTSRGDGGFGRVSSPGS